MSHHAESDINPGPAVLRRSRRHHHVVESTESSQSGEHEEADVMPVDSSSVEMVAALALSDQGHAPRPPEEPAIDLIRIFQTIPEDDPNDMSHLWPGQDLFADYGPAEPNQSAHLSTSDDTDEEALEMSRDKYNRILHHMTLARTGAELAAWVNEEQDQPLRLARRILVILTYGLIPCPEHNVDDGDEDMDEDDDNSTAMDDTSSLLDDAVSQVMTTVSSASSNRSLKSAQSLRVLTLKHLSLLSSQSRAASRSVEPGPSQPQSFSLPDLFPMPGRARGRRAAADHSHSGPMISRFGRSAFEEHRSHATGASSFNRDMLPAEDRLQLMFHGNEGEHLDLNLSHKPKVRLQLPEYDIDAELYLFDDLSHLKCTLVFNLVPQFNKLLKKSVHIKIPITRGWRELSVPLHHIPHMVLGTIPNGELVYIFFPQHYKMPEMDPDRPGHTLPYKANTYMSNAMHERFFDEFIAPGIKELGDAFNNHTSLTYEMYKQAADAPARERGTDNNASNSGGMKIPVSPQNMTYMWPVLKRLLFPAKEPAEKDLDEDLDEDSLDPLLYPFFMVDGKNLKLSYKAQNKSLKSCIDTFTDKCKQTIHPDAGLTRYPTMQHTSFADIAAEFSTGDNVPHTLFARRCCQDNTVRFLYGQVDGTLTHGVDAGQAGSHGTGDSDGDGDGNSEYGNGDGDHDRDEDGDGDGDEDGDEDGDGDGDEDSEDGAATAGNDKAMDGEDSGAEEDDDDVIMGDDWRGGGDGGHDGEGSVRKEQGHKQPMRVRQQSPPVRRSASTTLYPIHLLNDIASITSEPAAINTSAIYGMVYYQSYTPTKEQLIPTGHKPYANYNIPNIAYCSLDRKPGIGTEKKYQRAVKAFTSSTNRVKTTIEKTSKKSWSHRIELRISLELMKHLKSEFLELIGLWMDLWVKQGMHPNNFANIDEDDEDDKKEMVITSLSPRLIPSAFICMPSQTYQDFLQVVTYDHLTILEGILAWGKHRETPRPTAALFKVVAAQLRRFLTGFDVTRDYKDAFFGGPPASWAGTETAIRLTQRLVRANMKRLGFGYLPRDTIDWRNLEVKHEYAKLFNYNSGFIQLDNHRPGLILSNPLSGYTGGTSSTLSSSYISSSYVDDVVQLFKPSAGSKTATQLVLDVLAQLQIESTRSFVFQKMVPKLSVASVLPDYLDQDGRLEWTADNWNKVLGQAGDPPVQVYKLNNRSEYRQPLDLYQYLVRGTHPKHGKAYPSKEEPPFRVSFSHIISVLSETQANAEAKAKAKLPGASLSERFEATLFYQFFAQHRIWPVPHNTTGGVVGNNKAGKRLVTAINRIPGFNSGQYQHLMRKGLTGNTKLHNKFAIINIESSDKVLPPPINMDELLDIDRLKTEVRRLVRLDTQ